MDPVFERLAHLPIRTLRIACGNEAHGVTRFVCCPRVRGSVSVERCAGCADCAAMPVNADARDAEVVCISRVDLDRPRPRDPSLDLREAMLRTKVGDLLAGALTCVHPETDLEMAIEILSRPDTKCVPVVDCDAKLVGILSEGDVVRESSFAQNGRTVADVMTPLVHALPEDAPLSFAVGLMAGARLRQVPVVGPDGRIIGMFTANDALRWVAQAIGYVL